MQLLIRSNEAYSLEQVNSRMHKDWGTIMYPVLNHPYNVKLFNKIEYCRSRHAVLPMRQDMFKVLRYPPSHYKVVVIGESPYFTFHEGKPSADGLAFSSHHLTPSLAKIDEAMKKELGSGLYSTNLDYLAEQGVLLLNAMLTVSNINGQKANHNKEFFKTADWSMVVRAILNSISPDTALLWGWFASKYKGMFRHSICCEHPVAASYERRQWNNNGCFKKTSHLINWNESNN